MKSCASLRHRQGLTSCGVLCIDQWEAFGCAFGSSMTCNRSMAMRKLCRFYILVLTEFESSLVSVFRIESSRTVISFATRTCVELIRRGSSLIVSAGDVKHSLDPWGLEVNYPGIWTGKCALGGMSWGASKLVSECLTGGEYPKIFKVIIYSCSERHLHIIQVARGSFFYFQRPLCPCP